MSKAPQNGDAEGHRKASFRETAREIVAKDRRDRKFGLTVDTAGAIARAMERTYRLGRDEARSGSVAPSENIVAAGGAIDWELIPPRPREAFWRVCFPILGDSEQSERSGHLVATLTDRRTPRWRLADPRYDSADDVIGGRSVTPLIRLGLLDAISGHDERLVISERDKATWRAFCARDGRYPEDLTRRKQR